MTTVLEKVQRIAGDLFHIASQKISAESSPSSIPAWDSVQQLNLILAVEQEFNVQFEPEDLDKIHTIGDIVAHLTAKEVS